MPIRTKRLALVAVVVVLLLGAGGVVVARLGDDEPAPAGVTRVRLGQASPS